MHLLECHKLTRHFGSLEALSDVDMKIEAGEVRAVIGPNGAGKSTLFNAVNGVFAPTRGYCLFNNINITNFPMHKIVKSGISRTFQLTHLFPELATAWWIVFFYDILGADFQVARECFYATTNLCSLKASAALFSEIPEYTPKLLWAGVAMFFIGLGLRTLKFRH